MGRLHEPGYHTSKGAYYSEVNGKMRRLLKGAKTSTNKAAARRELARILAEEDKAGVARADLLDLHSLIDHFLVMVRREKAPSTLGWYKGHLDSFAGRIGPIPCGELRPKHLDFWPDLVGLDPARGDHGRQVRDLVGVEARLSHEQPAQGRQAAEDGAAGIASPQLGRGRPRLGRGRGLRAPAHGVARVGLSSRRGLPGRGSRLRPEGFDLHAPRQVDLGYGADEGVIYPDGQAGVAVGRANPTTQRRGADHEDWERSAPFRGGDAGRTSWS